MNINDLDYGDFIELDDDAEPKLSYKSREVKQKWIPGLWAVDGVELESGMVNINRVEDPYPGAFCSWVHVDEIKRIVRKKKKIDEEVSSSQEETYRTYKSAGWKWDSNVDKLGRIIMKKNTSSIPDSPSWKYITIFKDGKVEQGYLDTLEEDGSATTSGDIAVVPKKLGKVQRRKITFKDFIK